MRLTVLGSAGSHPAAGRVCSGYLLEGEGVRVMLDCGNGSTANLQRLHGLRDLDAIIVTHRHIDHCIDLIGSYYALLDDADDHDPIAVHAAPDVLDFLTSLLSTDSTLNFSRVFETSTIDAGQHLEIGAFAFDFAWSIHPVPTLSVRVTEGDRCLVYSSDSAGGDGLVEVAKGADVLLCEATWDSLLGRPPGIHLDGSAAGQIARRAGVGRLLLTHVAGGTDRERLQQDAVREYGSDDVVQVEDLQQVEVS